MKKSAIFFLTIILTACLSFSWRDPDPAGDRHLRGDSHLDSRPDPIPRTSPTC